MKLLSSRLWNSANAIPKMDFSIAVLSWAVNLRLSLLRIMFTRCLAEEGRRVQVPHFIVAEWGTPVRVEFQLVTRP